MIKVLKEIADGLTYIEQGAAAIVIVAIGFCVWFISQHVTCVNIFTKLCVIH